ncbi:unnamed protein product [Symbiodinium pilosum]|uniref:Amino acid transporter transmembrane domain-containing protein n=1 Tax=Symbiodinium pilosum TaxID=2952 RepID=A0A812UZM5_SYMPI|nr:unnamed protein product [Symbiodinium pilosum]
MTLAEPLLHAWPSEVPSHLPNVKTDVAQAKLTPNHSTDSDNSEDVATGKGVPDTKRMTGAEATFTLVSFLLNVAMFTLPFCFVRVGWLAAFLIMLTGSICMLAALMLQEALYALVGHGVRCPDYSDLATAALGPAYASLAQLVALAELAIYGSNSVINLGNAAMAVCPLSRNSRILAGCMLCLLLSAFSDRAFAYINLISSAASIAILGLLLYGGWQASEWAMPDTIPDTSTDFWHYIPSCFAMMLFTAGTHPLICGVMHTTRSYMELRRAILSAWTIYTAVTVLCAGLAYQMYGSSLQPFAMDNIGRDLQLHLQEGGAKLKVAAGVWMAIKVLVGIVPITRPLANAYARKMSWLGQDEASGPLLMLPVLLSLAAAAVFFAERIEALESMAGCTVTSFNVLLLPAISYLLICKPSGASYCCAVSFVVLGAVLALSPMAYVIWRTASGFEDITRSFHSMAEAMSALVRPWLAAES